jgi:hypothetical protein
VERVGEQLLAGTALADDEHVGVGIRHRRDRLEHALNARRAPEDLRVGRLIHEPALEVRVLAEQLPPLERVLEEHEELVRLEWLLEDVKRAGALGRFHRLAHGAVGGDDEHLEGWIAPLELTRELQAVAVGQHQVHDGRVRIALDERPQRLAHASGRAHAVALALERHAQPVGDRLLVVDDENRVVTLHWSGGLEAGFDRGWPEIGASRLRTAEASRCGPRARLPVRGPRVGVRGPSWPDLECADRCEPAPHGGGIALWSDEPGFVFEGPCWCSRAPWRDLGCALLAGRSWCSSVSW